MICGAGQRNHRAPGSRPARGWSTFSPAGLALLAFLAVPCFILLVLSGCSSTPVRTARGSADSTRTGPSFSRPPLTSAPEELLPRPAPGPARPAPPPEELWIIARATDTNAPPLTNDVPGTGALMTKTAEGEKEMPLLLKRTDVKARVSAYIASVDVTQTFRNSYDRNIDATYVFPLPHNAAVNDFVISIGDRRIRGIIRERKEAERLFAEARRQGYTASLLTQEQPNLFQQAVPNIEPGKEIGVTIRYLHTLNYEDGWYEYVFPMVVGPRFNPPDTTNGSDAVADDATGASGQPAEAIHLSSNERSGLDIALQLEVDAALPIEETQCRTHVVEKDMLTPEKLLVKLSRSDRVPNRDFVFRYRVAGGRIKSGLLTHRNDRGGYFSLMLFPPQTRQELKRQPLEMIFVLDCSGSMSGRPLEQAKEAVARGLRLLEPEDAFQIVTFSMRASKLGPAPLTASPQDIERGLAWLNTLNAEGGTMMIDGIQTALDFPHDTRRLRFVVFLTDGLIGNEATILAEVQKRLGASRLFCFGIGSSVNRQLLEGLARLGRGAVAYVAAGDSATDVMDRFYERVNFPAMTDVQIDWGGMKVSEVYPKQVPDLFVGRPVLLTGRFEGKVPSAIRVTGRAANEPVAVTIPTRVGDAAGKHPGLPGVWARQKISDLTDRAIPRPTKELMNEIRQVALDYGLLSDFTAFVAVDSILKKEAGVSVTVPVETPVPEGVKPETTVKDR